MSESQHDSNMCRQVSLEPVVECILHRPARYNQANNEYGTYQNVEYKFVRNKVE